MQGAAISLLGARTANRVNRDDFVVVGFGRIGRCQIVVAASGLGAGYSGERVSLLSRFPVNLITANRQPGAGIGFRPCQYECSLVRPAVELLTAFLGQTLDWRDR